MHFDRHSMQLRPLRRARRWPPAPSSGASARRAPSRPTSTSRSGPRARHSPKIDPKPILDGWKLLEETAIYRAAGKDPFTAGRADTSSVAQDLLLPKSPAPAEGPRRPTAVHLHLRSQRHPHRPDRRADPRRDGVPRRQRVPPDRRCAPVRSAQAFVRERSAASTGDQLGISRSTGSRSRPPGPRHTRQRTDQDGARPPGDHAASGDHLAEDLPARSASRSPGRPTRSRSDSASSLAAGT